jgi:hypothetical protein
MLRTARLAMLLPLVAAVTPAAFAQDHPPNDQEKPLLLPAAAEGTLPGLGTGAVAWLNIWTSDVILRYDPNANQWTTFDLPTRGTEARYVSLLEKDGKMEVVVPYSRTSKVAVMTFRSEADLAALMAQAERP